MLGSISAGLACRVLYSLHSCVTQSKTAPNFSKCAVILMYICFRSSTQLTAGFGDQKISRQMQKCNPFFLFLFLKPLKIVKWWFIQSPENVLWEWHYSVQGSAVKKNNVLPFIMSVCVGFSLAAVLHVEVQNVYYPKISNMVASREGSLSAQWGSDLNSSWFSQPAQPPPPTPVCPQSIGNQSVVHFSPSSRMHVMFHSCWVAW